MIYNINYYLYLLKMNNNKKMFDINNSKKYKILNEKKFKKIKIKNKKRLKMKKLAKSFKISINWYIMKIFIILILLFIRFLFLKSKKRKHKEKYEYFACASGMGKKENRYVRELVEYYLKLGFGKFILGDNNLPNTEKFSDVIQDYIDDGTVDIIELYGSTFGQSALNNLTYEKYNKRCKWMLFFDFDEFLEVHFEQNKSLPFKDFLTNKIFDNCEAVLFNVLVYTDNNLVHYDNRPLNVRFTEPNYNHQANDLVKAIVRGNLNKTIFEDGKPNNSPVEGVEICDSMGRKIQSYNAYFLRPPVYDYGYLKHFTTKTAEEYIDKINKGTPGGFQNNVEERIRLFFEFNKYSDEKMEIFQKYYNRTFDSNNIEKQN